MKRIPSLIFISILLSSLIYSQDNLNDVRMIASEFKKIQIIRMSSGTDMLEGLKNAIEKYRIKNAIILAGIGSVTDYHVHVVSDKM